MKLLVVGGGGREHAIIKKLKENSNVEKIFALPGNGGIAADAECIDIAASDIDNIVKFAVDNKIDFAVVAPDDPLVLGAVDSLNKAGIRCFGPTKAAAIIEGSKAFSKNLMKKYNIPTAKYEIFKDLTSALKYVENCPIPTVIKADGLALGKGVIIAQTRDEAKEALISMMKEHRFGDSGTTVVIEEFLEGPEVSVLCFTDGKTLVPMVSSMDHKRALDNDTGLNTGGMGTVAPNPYYTKDVAKICYDTIFIPTINAMNRENRSFKGCLYFGLMITKDGPKVIEYNCRFGDPETQVVLPLLESDLLDIMIACENGTLENCPVKFKDEYACCVILASGGYPEKYGKDYPISIDGKISENSTVYYAGVKLIGGKLLTSGGRVLGVTATAESLEKAVEFAYNDAGKISFENSFMRHDIGKKALAARG